MSFNVQIIYTGGNQDSCFHNYKCVHPLGIINTFNSVWSNIALLLLGFLFVLVVTVRWAPTRVYNIVEGRVTYTLNFHWIKILPSSATLVLRKKFVEKVFANVIKITIFSMQSLSQDKNCFCQQKQVAKLAKIFSWYMVSHLCIWLSQHNLVKSLL